MLFRSIMVFSHQTFKLFPVTAEQAQGYLLDWLQVWQQAAQQPWVLPPDLVLDKDHGLRYVKKSDAYEYTLEKLLEKWRGEGFNRTIAPSDDESCYLHPDWQLVLQGQDAEQALMRHLATHAERLYQPLLERWQDFDPLAAN